MPTIFTGPARTLTLGDGKVIERGQPVHISKATRAALEKAGVRFRDEDAPKEPDKPAKKDEASHG